mmetsp:Transcript_6558/g.14518  ORF Transcript_6558/g.14518 Transcript_6558/m.14518 type:complete len:226 (+) Transcript_6558:3587-4264(+)
MTERHVVHAQQQPLAPSTLPLVHEGQVLHPWRQADENRVLNDTVLAVELPRHHLFTQRLGKLRVLPGQLAGQLQLEALVRVLQVAQHHHRVRRELIALQAGNRGACGASCRGADIHFAMPVTVAEHVQQVHGIFTHLQGAVHDLVEDEAEHDVGLALHRVRGVDLTHNLEEPRCDVLLKVIAAVQAGAKEVEVGVQQVREGLVPHVTLDRPGGGLHAVVRVTQLE